MKNAGTVLIALLCAITLAACGRSDDAPETAAGGGVVAEGGAVTTSTAAPQPGVEGEQQRSAEPEAAAAKAVAPESTGGPELGAPAEEREALGRLREAFAAAVRARDADAFCAVVESRFTQKGQPCLPYGFRGAGSLEGVRLASDITVLSMESTKATVRFPAVRGKATYGVAVRTPRGWRMAEWAMPNRPSYEDTGAVGEQVCGPDDRPSAFTGDNRPDPPQISVTRQIAELKVSYEVKREAQAAVLLISARSCEWTGPPVVEQIDISAGEGEWATGTVTLDLAMMTGLPYEVGASLLSQRGRSDNVDVLVR